jgi:hypothetical protein
MAVAEGILAAEERSAERYKEAKRRLLAWCDMSGVSQPRRDLAVGQFKERVALVAGPKAPVPPSSPGLASCSAPPNGLAGAFLMNAAIMSDEDRLRAIDQGRA